MVLYFTVLLGFGIANVAGACSSEANLKYNEKKGNIELDIQDFCTRCASEINSTISKDRSSDDKDITYELSVSYKIENGVLSMEALDAMMLCILYNKSKHKESLIEDTEPRMSKMISKSVNMATVYDNNKSTFEEIMNKSEPLNKINYHYAAQSLRSDFGNITEIISDVSSNTVYEKNVSIAKDIKETQETFGVSELPMEKTDGSNIKNIDSTTFESIAESELNEKTSTSSYIDTEITMKIRKLTTPTAENGLKSRTEENETSIKTRILYESDEKFESTLPNTRKNTVLSYSTLIHDPINIQDVRDEISDKSTETQVYNTETNDIRKEIELDGTENYDRSTESHVGSTEADNFSTETLDGSNETKEINEEDYSTEIQFGDSQPKLSSKGENSTQPEKNMKKNVTNALGIIALINIMLIVVLLLILLGVAINRIRKSGMSFRLLPVRKHYALLPLQDRWDMDQGVFTIDLEA